MCCLSCLYLAAVTLNPRGESVPRRCFANRYADLLHEDEVSAGPERGAMNLSRGPEIVSPQGEQKQIGEQRRHCRFSENDVDRPTRNCGDQQCRRRDDDEALVCWGIAAGAKGKENQRRKNQPSHDREKEMIVAAAG